MHKADFEDTWETNFLLYQLPVLVNTIKLIGKNKDCLDKNELNQAFLFRNSVMKILDTIK